MMTAQVLGCFIRTSIEESEPFCVSCATQYIDWSDAWAQHARSHNLGCEILSTDEGVDSLFCAKCGCSLLESVSPLDAATACVNAAANNKRPGR